MRAPAAVAALLALAAPGAAAHVYMCDASFSVCAGDLPSEDPTCAQSSASRGTTEVAADTEPAGASVRGVQACGRDGDRVATGDGVFARADTTHGGAAAWSWGERGWSTYDDLGAGAYGPDGVILVAIFWWRLDERCATEVQVAGPREDRGCPAGPPKGSTGLPWGSFTPPVPWELLP